MRKLFFTLVVCCVSIAHAQKKMVIEKFRCLSATGPTMSYLKDAAIRKTMASQLSQTLVKLGYPALADTNSLGNVAFPARIAELTTGDIAFTGNDTSRLHLYLDLYEIAPGFYFSAFNRPHTDTTITLRARSVFLLKAVIFRHDKKQVFAEELHMVISPAEAAGMGTVYNTRMGYLGVTPKGFTEMFKSGTQLLFDSKNELAMIEMKISPAFIADDYILPKVGNRPRTFVSTVKNISRYRYNENDEMIRLGDAVYEEIVLRGKKAQKYPADLTAQIKDAPHYAVSDFVFLREECRDVLRDKNYLLKLTVQVDPQNMREPPLTFTNFLPGQFNYLLLEKDTLAKFSIETDRIDPAKHLYPAQVSNGIDSSSFFTINTTEQPYTVRYQYVVQGMMGLQPFRIRCSGNRNTVKEIFLGDDLVCIAQGKFSPERFVVFDASLSPELLNRLLMIGFNRFFE